MGRYKKYRRRSDSSRDLKWMQIYCIYFYEKISKKYLILPKKHDILLIVEKTHKGSIEGSAEEVLKCVELYGSQKQKRRN